MTKQGQKSLWQATDIGNDYDLLFLQKEQTVKMSTDFSSLKRPRNPMPDFVKMALEESGLMEAYNERPAYQQNDYLGWISRTKRQETKLKRLRQMLDELKQGGIYMNMRQPASNKS